MPPSPGATPGSGTGRPAATTSAWPPPSNSTRPANLHADRRISAVLCPIRPIHGRMRHPGRRISAALGLESVAERATLTLSDQPGGMPMIEFSPATVTHEGVHVGYREHFEAKLVKVNAKLAK